MEKKVRELLVRLNEVEELLGQPGVLSDQKTFRALAQEHAYLRDLAQTWDDLQKTRQQLSDNKALLKTEEDPEFVSLLNEEVAKQEASLPVLERAFELLLVPPDPNDHRTTI